MSQTYIILDDDSESILKTQAIAERFKSLTFVASATNYEDGLNLILEHQPQLIFLEIDPKDKKSNLSLILINELYRYLRNIPKIIITTVKKDQAYEALQYEVIDYLLKPININEFRKSILKFDRAIHSDLSKSEHKNPVATFEVLDEAIIATLNEVEVENEGVKLISSSELKSGAMETTSIPLENQRKQSLIICVKSYGDYRYIDSDDVLYLEADNNSTDIHLTNGEMITAFKTLKHFENTLPNSQFLRIHNSYMININQVSRIHTGNTVCYIKNSATKIPFSKSYKENIDLIITRIAAGNYLEI